MMIEDEANGNVIPNYSPTQSVSTTSESSTLENFPLGTPPNNPSPEKKKPVEFETKKLNRGISRATDNVNLVSQARSEIIVDSSSQECCLETPLHTFALPDLTGYPDDFRTFLEKDLIAVSTQISLEQANRLNWWTSYCQRLWPLSTSGDGNCLLHAASLGMWGFHDRLLTLRKTLHAFLTQSPRKDALWRRWRRQQSLLNAQSGLMYSEVEWRQEWNAIVNMASSEPRLRRLSIQSEPGSENTSGNIYESLEEIHVLALAHVLKRPIVVVADTVLKDMNGEALAPIPFGGIYLPLECLPSECHRSPLLLAYDGGHFSALVSMDSPLNGLSSAIPLTDMSGELLPIQFNIDPGPNGNESECSELSHGQSIDLLSSYLDLIRQDSQNPSPTDESKNSIFGSIGKSVGAKLKLKLSRNNSQRQTKSILCAVLHLDKRPEYHETMIRNYLETAELRFKMSQENKMESEETANGGLRYNAGNSHFYTEVDTESHEKVLQLSPVKPPLNMDSTLYLSNSTFYEPPSQKCLASQCPFFGNPQTQNYCSKCFKELFCSTA